MLRTVGPVGTPETLVGVVESVQNTLIEDRGVTSHQGVAGVTKEIVHVPQAGGEPAGGVGVAARQQQVGLIPEQALTGFTHNLGSRSVDQLNGLNPQRGFI
jgi:hypothetical protein